MNNQQNADGLLDSAADINHASPINSTAFSPASNTSVNSPITVFSIAKAFQGTTDQIQRNAINSWTHLPGVEVIIAGDDVGTRESAMELNVHHLAGIRTNQLGTPLVSDVFERVRLKSNSPILVYCNCDVILFPSFVESLSSLTASEEIKNGFLAIGRRNDLRVDTSIDFDDETAVAQIEQNCRNQGIPASVVCKEYFAYTRNLFAEVPDFAVGRGNWDNWMVASAQSGRLASCRHIAIHADYSPTTQLLAPSKKPNELLRDWPGSASKPTFGWRT